MTMRTNRLVAPLIAVALGAAVAPVARGATTVPKLNASCTAAQVGRTVSGLTCTRNAAGRTVWTRAAAAATTKAPAATSAPATTAAAAPARTGGKMVFAVEAETSGGWTASAVQWAMSGNIVRQTMIENLVMPNSDGLPECLLCESITPNARFTEWTIKARPGIKFHNGEALDGAAMKANFDDLRRAGAVTAPLLRPITSVDVVDDLTVKLTLNAPFINFAAILLNQRSAMVAPAQLRDPQGRNKPIGTGPYVFKEWKLNDTLTVTRNPNYWRNDVKPSLDEITFKVITEETARVTAFKSGDIQGLMTVNPIKIAELKDLEKNKKGTVIEIIKNPGINNILFQMERFPTSDLRVRQALVLALDRNALNEINNAGILKVIDVPFVPGDSSKLTGLYPKTDLDKAKALIKQVEQETGRSVELTLSTSAVPENIENAQTVQQYWEKAGVKVRIQAVEQAAYVRQCRSVTSRRRRSASSPHSTPRTPAPSSTARAPRRSGR